MDEPLHDPDRWDQLSALFKQALALPPEERSALLDRAADSALRRELQSLLAADAEGGFTDRYGGVVEVAVKALFPHYDMKTGREIAHYRILEKLGGGGMGIVYKAIDTRLDRTVTLKFLPPHLSLDEAAKERFFREARAAARLDHPNICTIHDIAETDEGLLFMAMAYYDGETLKQRIARSPIPLSDALDYARQVGEGLAAAHVQGIVHRDVKPANVMITARGEVKVLDFGVAKTGGADLTRTGTTVGTVAYMSPEQARGEAVDHRTDLWSLGVVLYEMLAGTRPFQGDYDQAVLYRILNEQPEPVTGVRPEVPVALADLVDTLLEKEPARRVPSAAALLERLRVVPMQAGGAATSGASAAGRPAWQAEASIAVLPFSDMSPGRDQDYFCEGLAEELINALARLDGLHVASRTSSFLFKNKAFDVREIGRRLQVGSVLEGSVRKAGNRLRVTVQLIDTANGYHRWSERYDRELEDVFALQDEIAENTVRALRGVLTDEDRAVIQQAQPADIRAYEYYLQGRYASHQSSRLALERARRLFEQAIEIDPAYAPPYAGIAFACHFLYLWFERSEAHLAEADRFSRRAIELAPGLAESHVARSLALAMHRQFAEAEQAIDAALRLDPDNYDAHYFYGRLCFMQGKYEGAARYFERASQLDPQEYQASSLLSMPYEELGRTDLLEGVNRKALQRVEQRLALDPHDVRAINMGATALVHLGEVERGIEWTRRALAMAPDDAGVVWNAACTYARAGALDEALDGLERAIELGIADRDWLAHDPDMAPLRDHPRFIALLERMG